ncbi:glutamyl-tRNA reductase [Echinicola jeungdonensis]|uniref:Glutamyl-tRNA reductase n=1 Tax=Echinicola jeungdonensis TaxID=709343 RepID=A0ABV5J8X2_9BACT|nr:glutamyl-tRNA reductase [Echinicola jeungdonensis]MDN3670217.1 glutamyl-tRNA reductase [Echinicola jeungdonensis]
MRFLLKRYTKKLSKIMDQFRLLSLSFKNTDIKTREAFALSPAEIRELIQASKNSMGLKELLVLSTCNRTEIIYFADKDLSLPFFNFLSQLKGQNTSLAKRAFHNIQNEKQALNYFFKISAGLESQILGDAQIISQIKNAYQISLQENTAGTYIHRLIHILLATHKKITTQTDFKSGISSVPYASVDLIYEYQSMIHSPKIGIIGFGEMGQNVCKHLISGGNTKFTVLNRSREKLDQFNKKHNTQIQYLPLKELEDAVRKLDIIISTPRVVQPIISQNTFNDYSPTYKLLVDISMPRSIAQDVENIPGIIYFDMDNISQVTQQSMARKEASVQAVKQILKDHQEEFMQWKTDNKNLEVIRKMKSTLQTIKEEELDRFQKLTPPELSEGVDEILDAMIQKIIKKTVVTMKSLKDEKQINQYSTLISQTFH